MSEVKSLIASKTFWGALVAVAAGMLAGGNYALAAVDQAELVDLLVAVGAGGGGVVAIVGRVLARARVGKAIAEQVPLGIGAFLLLALAGCGFTPQGGLIRSQVLEKGAQAYDYGLDNSELFLCQIASVGSVERRYWRNQEDFDTWARFCRIGAAARDLRLEAGTKTKSEPGAQPVTESTP